jgi:hypothetical protein
MSARGTAFLQLWLERNVLTLPLDRDQAPRLAHKLTSDAADEGVDLKDLEIKAGSIEDYIRDMIVHVGEPGMPGD